MVDHGSRTMDTNLADRVRQFVCDFWYENPRRLRADTRLEEDLGMTGEDAAEFLEAFAEAFEVDLTGIEFHKHFGLGVRRPDPVLAALVEGGDEGPRQVPRDGRPSGRSGGGQAVVVPARLRAEEMAEASPVQPLGPGTGRLSPSTQVERLKYSWCGQSLIRAE